MSDEHSKAYVEEHSTEPPGGPALARAETHDARTHAETHDARTQAETHDGAWGETHTHFSAETGTGFGVQTERSARPHPWLKWMTSRVALAAFPWACALMLSAGATLFPEQLARLRGDEAQTLALMPQGQVAAAHGGAKSPGQSSGGAGAGSKQGATAGSTRGFTGLSGREDMGGPCDISWLLTAESLRLESPLELRQAEAELPSVSYWPSVDLHRAASRITDKALTPVTRNTPVLVVMVQFPDVTFSSAGNPSNATHAEWRRRVLGLTSQSNGTLAFDPSVTSMADYWNEASFGRVNLRPVTEHFDAGAAQLAGINAPDALANDGIVQVTLDLEPYQLGYYWTLQPRSEYTYVASALRAANPYVDFKALDTNLDGVVDHQELAILLVFANPNQEEMGDWVWAHRFALPPRSLKVDGVSVAGGDPSINPVVQGGSYLMIDQYQPDRTLRHEFGHDLGLPDLYNVTVTGERHDDGIGEWGVMASSDGYPDGWSRYQLGWIREEDGSLLRIHASGEYHLAVPPSVSRTPQPGMVTLLERPGAIGIEYFLIENRQQEGQYERKLPGEGLVIFHVLDNRVLYRLSAVNLGTGTHAMGLKVMEADGNWDLMDPNDYNRGDAGDPFLPGDRFSPDSNPSSLWYGPQASGEQGAGSTGPRAAVINSHIYLDDIQVLDESGTMGATVCIGESCEP